MSHCSNARLRQSKDRQSTRSGSGGDQAQHRCVLSGSRATGGALQLSQPGGLIGGLALSWVISPILNLRQHPDHPGELLGEDINPLRKHYWFVSIYATVLVVLTFVGVFLSRR